LFALTVKAEEQTPMSTGLQEQSFESEFKAIEYAEPLSNTIDFKNEFFQSIRVQFLGMEQDMEIYFDPYELKEKTQINRSKNYEVLVFDAYDNYLGSLMNANFITDKVIKISPFYLIQDYRLPAKNDKPLEVKSPQTVDTTNPQPIAIKLDSQPAQSQSPAATNVPDGKRKIKIANIASGDLDITLQDEQGAKLGHWLIASDIYEPNFLTLDDGQALELDANNAFSLTVTKNGSNSVITKPVKDLTLDETGNYSWVIEKF
jgi:hypothetical protein